MCFCMVIQANLSTKSGLEGTALRAAQLRVKLSGSKLPLMTSFYRLVKITEDSRTRVNSNMQEDSPLVYEYSLTPAITMYQGGKRDKSLELIEIFVEPAEGVSEKFDHYILDMYCRPDRRFGSEMRRSEKRSREIIDDVLAKYMDHISEYKIYGVVSEKKKIFHN